MKVCFLLSDITKVGGIERVTSTLVNEFICNKEINVEIVSLFKGRSAPGYPIAENIPIHYLKHDAHGATPHSLKRAINMFSTLSLVRKFFKNHNYDVVVVQSFPPALLSFFSGFNRKKIIVAEHVYAEYYGNIINRFRTLIYSKFGKIVVLTTNDLKFFQCSGIGEKVTVIPNPVLPSSEPKSTCDNKRIITVGRLVYQKGFDNLIKAFKPISEHHPDWKLDIYGDGPLKSDLENLINEYHLEEKVNLCGLSSQIPKEFSTSSIFVMSSHFEGFPMVLIEALTQGVPCISFDCPNGPSDIIKNGVNGLLVENQNIHDLANAIELLIKNDNERKRLGNNAPDSIKQFSKDIIIKKWYELFESIK